MMAVQKAKRGRAVKEPRILAGEFPADGTVVEMKAEKKKKAAPREGDLVDVHSQVLGVHGLHLVLESDDQPGFRVQVPGSHEVKRVSPEEIESVFRKV